MSAFVDSSALVKLYVPEPGHHDIESLAPALIISQLALVEVPAAFWRKSRIGELDAAHARALSSAFDVDVVGAPDIPGRYVITAVDDRIVDEAARLVAIHPLRAYDSVQLASAVLARRAVDTPLTFAAFDVALRTAASAEGFAVSPAALPVPTR